VVEVSRRDLTGGCTGRVGECSHVRGLTQRIVRIEVVGDHVVGAGECRIEVAVDQRSKLSR
jgi:hypothetical protein